MSRVMLVGLAKKDQLRFQKVLGAVQVKCEAIPTLDAALERIPADPPALVITEKPELAESLDALQSTLKTSAPTTPFLVVLKDDQMTSAIQAMKAGAYDCLTKPLDRVSILAATKRAVYRNGRTLFVTKVVPPKKRKAQLLGLTAGIGVVIFSIFQFISGPPAPVVSLGSATLSGLQWESRVLWVGNWVDSTVTAHRVKRGLWSKARSLETEALYRAQDVQPILVCNTPEALITVSFDLKMRSHQRSVGLPILQSVSVPGTNPTGLAWDGEYLWSSDGQTGVLYRHGVDFRVLETVRSLVPRPIGLAWSEGKLWVLGQKAGSSLFLLASLEPMGGALVWRGPYEVANMLAEGVEPSGMAVGFGRLWLASGGDPRMVSRDLKAITSLISWNPKLAIEEKR